ncbi:uncharacterized protein N0V89_003890 [Didymosphaeria variabile]|uniref:Uncharacterized protein n=1 Tax=Didymosphaeria variabile TaxID=1932322 RepID=A0A9W9CBX7_9PLEO|nr:uncharacterized protein N0V89_003890 [Didymosphaeria variabile]KAJ4355869.1 hypothetical protein N0V89_003890 [Didymosphaeria variabile]
MGNLQFPPNPTSYRRTGWQIFLMLLMGMNYLMDHDPRHVQFSKDLRAKRRAKTHCHKSGFITELPDDYDDENKHAYNPLFAHAPRSANVHHPYKDPPSVARNGKEAWPYPRKEFHHEPHVENDSSRHGPKPTSRMQMRDAWTRMRAVTKRPLDYVRYMDSRKKRVTFDRDVQWYIYVRNEDACDGDSEVEMDERQ